MNVRHIYLENETGERINCLLRSSFFNDLQGLGFANEYNFLRARDGFWFTALENTVQQTISGMMSFLDRRDAYEEYRTLTTFLNSAKRLSLIYIPYGNDEYYIDIKILSMSKGEIDLGGFLSCDIEFICLTPWYNNEPVELSFDGTLIDGIKKYDYQYEYKYGIGSVKGEVTLEIDGDFNGGLDFVAYGGFSDPILSLYNTNRPSENYGYLDLTGQTFLEGEDLVFRTTFKDSGVWKKTGNTMTNLMNSIVIHQNRDVFFTIPPYTPLTLKFTVSGTLTTPTEINIYKYWKTR